jgi:hypothetical protein
VKGISSSVTCESSVIDGPIERCCLCNLTAALPPVGKLPVVTSLRGGKGSGEAFNVLLT